MVLAERAHPVKFLIHDRDTKFTSSFDEVFRAESTRTIRTPIRAPRANAVRRALRRHGAWRVSGPDADLLEQVLGVYVAHYNEHRPHRSLSLISGAPSTMETNPVSIREPDLTRLRRTDKLGGLIHEYKLAA